MATRGLSDVFGLVVIVERSDARPVPVRLRCVVLSSVLLAGLLVLSGCVAAPLEQSAPDPVHAQTTLPADFLTVAADPDAVINAITVSAALFDTAGLVVTAPVGQPAAQLLAASAAASLGVPLLLMPGSEVDTATAVDAEISRLGADHVLSVGGQVPATVAAVNAVLPKPLPVVTVESAATALQALAGVHPLSPALLHLAPTGAPSPTPEDPGPLESPAAVTSPAEVEDPDQPGSLPAVTRSPVRNGGVLLAVDHLDQLAAVATARAASVTVRLMPAEQVNPQAHGALVTALARSMPTAVVVAGAPFAAELSLDWKVRTAATGVQLPGGGQTLFPARRFVALYGTPGTPTLGVLGEQPVAESIVRAQQTAAAYAPFSDRPVIALHEIIATVAAAESGPDGNYSNEISADELRPWVEAAGAAGAYVVLDLQPGRSDFLSQARQYEALLVLPHVGLALDPEWRLGPGQRHLAQIGGVHADEINAVSAWLAELTRRHTLPQKLLVVHQFRASMIENRTALITTHPELAVLLHVDGLGSQPDKQATWVAIRSAAPAGVAWGWKNFYDEDVPVLTPEQTMTQVSPTPDLVTYQ